MKALALKLIGALLFLSALAMWMSRAPDWPVEALVAYRASRRGASVHQSFP